MPDILVGAVAPESLKVIINQGSSGVDLTTATAVQLVVIKKGDNTRQSWTGCVINSQTLTTLAVTHTFQPGDVGREGVYSVIATVTIPSGTVRARCGTFRVVGV
jgi:RES domain-containing protein